MSFSIDWLSNPKAPSGARFELSVKIFEKAAGPGYPVVEHVPESPPDVSMPVPAVRRGSVRRTQADEDGIECWSTMEWRTL